MVAGELGADYVLFGEPDAQGQRPSVEAIAERLRMVGRIVRAALRRLCGLARGGCEFAAAGADFVLVGDFIWADPRGAAAALADVERGDPAGARERLGTARAGQG